VRASYLNREILVGSHDANTSLASGEHLTITVEVATGLHGLSHERRWVCDVVERKVEASLREWKVRTSRGDGRYRVVDRAPSNAKLVATTSRSNNVIHRIPVSCVDNKGATDHNRTHGASNECSRIQLHRSHR
jgi:hypothetical protein